MRVFSIARAFWAAALVSAAGPMLHAQSSPPAVQTPAAQTPLRPQQPQVIRRSFDLFQTDVIVRDDGGQFIADLKKDDFEVYEDGVKQDVISFILRHGARTYNETAPPASPAMEGIILPLSRPTSDAAGRIFIIFIDDLHLDFGNTGRIRELFKQISTELIHEGDRFGIVSSGYSSIAIELTYDRTRLDEALKKLSGAGLTPNEILDAPVGANGLAEVNQRAHVAFATANDLMKSLEQVHDRRKAFIYLSNGYDLNPFKTTREKNDKERWASMTGGSNNSDDGSGAGNDNTNVDPFAQQGNKFSEADLIAQLAEVTRAANRANVSIYAIDSRGLVGMPNLNQKIDMVEWQNYVTTSQNTLRMLSELTGGFAIVNKNDFTKDLKRIDAETSDYYIVGYYSTNADPLQRRRKVEVKVNRKGANVYWRKEYSLKPAQQK